MFHLLVVSFQKEKYEKFFSGKKIILGGEGEGASLNCGLKKYFKEKAPASLKHTLCIRLTDIGCETHVCVSVVDDSNLIRES